MAKCKALTEFSVKGLIPSQNRIENIALYSINNEVACCIKARSKAVMFTVHVRNVISCNAGSQSLVPFPAYTVDHSLIKTVPLLLDALGQLFHIIDLVHVNVVLQS